MFSSFNTRICSSKRGTIEDAIRSAPCPPPMISFVHFRDYALNNSLLLKDICSIARRCYSKSTKIVNDCLFELTNCTTSKENTTITTTTSTPISIMTSTMVIHRNDDVHESQISMPHEAWIFLIVVILFFIVLVLAFFGIKIRNRKVPEDNINRYNEEQSKEDDEQCPEVEILLSDFTPGTNKDDNRNESVC